MLAEREAGLKQDFEPFERAVQYGVSANLCSALADMGEMVPEARVEIRFTWARTRRRVVGGAEPFVLSSDAVPVMREAARVLRETYWDDDFELAGPVVRLDSHDPLHGGEVVVHAEIEPGSWRKVRVSLNGKDYDQAMKAHQNNWDVRCRGKLRKEGSYVRLQDPREFGVVPNPQ